MSLLSNVDYRLHRLQRIDIPVTSCDYKKTTKADTEDGNRKQEVLFRFQKYLNGFVTNFSMFKVSRNTTINITVIYNCCRYEGPNSPPPPPSSSGIL